MKLRTLGVLLAVAVATLGPLSPAVGPADGVAAGPTNAPWWGPGDPGDRTTGWHFRFPVVVANPYTYALVDAAVMTEVDLGRLLINAGWNARSLGSTSFPTSFTLDPESLRVVQYSAGFVDITSETPLPSRFYPGRFSVAAQAPYSASRAPAGTVVFVAEGELAPGSERSYMVYFTSIEQDGRAQDARPGLVAGWAARGWGLAVYGFEQGGAQGRNNRVDVFAREGDTTVTVYTYRGGRPVVADLTRVPNPSTLSPGPPLTISLPSHAFFKITGTKPIAVASRGSVEESGDPTYGGGAFVPATSGGMVGTHFFVPGYAPQAYVVTARPGSASVKVIDEGGGTVQTLDLSTARPFGTVEMVVLDSLTSTSVRQIVVTGVPVTVQLAGTLVGSHVVPGRTGEVGAVDHWVAAPPGTLVRLRPFEPANLRAIHAGRPTLQLYPYGPAGLTPAAVLAAGPGAPLVANDTWPRDAPVRLLSVVDGGGGGEPARIFVAVGQGAPAGPFYLDDRLSTYVRGATAIMGALNATRVTITERLSGGATKVTAETLNRDGVILFEPDPSNLDGEAVLVATKPASVLPRELRETYARMLPAHGGAPTAVVGPLEFRGALVRLTVAGAVGGQAVRTIGPGQSATFELEVQNRGRWLANAPITEDVELLCDAPPPGWTVTGCGEPFAVASGQTRRLSLTITPTDVPPGSRLLLKVAASGLRWNTTDEGQIALLVREAFGVETWFFAQGGPKDLGDLPFYVNKGSTTRVPFVVKNTGTVRDGYDLRLFPSQPGWAIETLLGGSPVKTVTLEPGATAQLEFEVRADADPASPQTALGLEAVSLSNELAADTLRGAVQILTLLDVVVRSPQPVGLLEPGRLHSFPIEIENRGEAIVTVNLTSTPALPVDWASRVPVREVSVFPGNTTRLNVTVRPPADAPAGDRGTVSLVAGASRSPGENPTEVRLILTGLVRHVHDIGFPTEPIAVSPGPGTELNLPLVNNGNGEEEIIVLGLTPTSSFRTPGPLFIAPGETGVLSLSIDISPQTPPGRANLTIHTSLARAAQLNVTLPLQFIATPRLTVTLADPRPLLPGKPVNLVAEVRAAGNVALRGELKALVDPSWDAVSEPARVDLEPGEAIEATFTITPAADARDGVAEIGFSVVPEIGLPAEAPARSLPIGRPDLRLFGVAVGELAGGGLLVSARVANNGTVDARDVEVALVRQREGLAAATVARIAPGSHAVVSLATEETGSARGLLLVADPNERIPDPDRRDNVVALEGRGLAIPLWLAPLALGAAALVQRRRRKT